jgi:DNA topoisomerase-2
MDVERAPIVGRSPERGRTGELPRVEVPRVEVPRVEEYVKVTQKEHILLRPDTYVGSVEKCETLTFVPVKDEQGTVHMEWKNISFVPGLFKIFDEILVNAADNCIRDGNTDTVKVIIDPVNNEISVYNNGKGIPVAIHEKEKIYIPEMIFGHLLTGSNYNDKEKRITGGRNGYGAKLANILSKEFSIETHDSRSETTYRQKWTGNMEHCSPPKMTKSAKKSDYTKITFKPDLGKFNMDKLDADILAVFEKRVYDLTGSLRGVRVFLNGERIKVASFSNYVALYAGDGSSSSSSPPAAAEVDAADDVRVASDEESVSSVNGLQRTKAVDKPAIAYEKINGRWEVALMISGSSSFHQVSFVNSICTTKGGTHVNYVADQIISHVLDAVRKKSKVKDKEKIKSALVKNQMFLFINCSIENPSFDGQTKETMTRKVSQFGSTCEITDSFMKKVFKLGIVESTLEMLREKEEAQLKKTDGKGNQTRLSGIVKLMDANDAGKKGKNCTLMLVEGDSAMNFPSEGIPVLSKGRDKFGAFPLRGKLLNVRECTASQRRENVEINQLKKILGLKEGCEYFSASELRYSRICILVDSDPDGSHIKGLILNWLAHSFPSLLRIPGFVVDFKSPIVKCTKGKEEILFYTLREYHQWSTDGPGANGENKKWDIKYYKGLGTSKSTDIKKYFSQLDAHLKEFHPLREEDAEKLDMVFSKKRASDRKQWLQGYRIQRGTSPVRDARSASSVLGIAEHPLPDEEKDTVIDFIDNELIEFSMYDNIRSIPSMVDGLKPGQRKILFTAFKTNLKSDVKVAQFSAEVSKLTEYRHGEQSLNETIIGMAQEFIGSNNLALLSPEGNFGSRRLGGKDAASPRYIFTKLKRITRKLFPAEDDAVLDYLVEDGHSIEPQFFIPIIPMVLVNGAKGIGSGYSTEVLCYNPMDIVSIIILLCKRNINDPLDVSDYSSSHSASQNVDADVDVDVDADVDLGEKRKRGKDLDPDLPLLPWYRGFTGNILEREPGKWVFTGKVARTGNVLSITELPIGTSIEQYKLFLEKLLENSVIRKYDEYHTGTLVHFKVEVNERSLDILTAGSLESEEENLVKNLELSTSKTSTNMMLFSEEGKLKKFQTAMEIVLDFYTVRLVYYDKRKSYMLEKLQSDRIILENKVRFVEAILAGTLVLNKKKKVDIYREMEKKNFFQMGDGLGSHFQYLLNMPLMHLTNEKIQELQKEMMETKQRYEDLFHKSLEEMYLYDLEELKLALVEHEQELKASLSDPVEDRKEPAAKRKKTGKK